jgi:hypothetical protein
VNTEKGLGQRQHFVAFEDDLILVLLESDAVARQFGADLAVAQQRCRFVVAVARHGGDAQFARQRRHQISCPAVLHDESAAECAQGGVQFDDRCMDELDPPVGGPAFLSSSSSISVSNTKTHQTGPPARSA